MLSLAIPNLDQLTEHMPINLYHACIALRGVVYGDSFCSSVSSSVTLVICVKIRQTFLSQSVLVEPSFEPSL